MRLLQLHADNTLSFSEYLIADLPPFAILSHTWGSDDEEVNYLDVLQSTCAGKAGYQKLMFCGQQAKRDGLDYFWVDTCCIDKRSSAELSEAINSMFRWYYLSSRCYVYLRDVSWILKESGSDKAWENGFKESRWFTRGWTLQELIAPRHVDFFTCEEERLGNKLELRSLIQDITGISLQVLQGSPVDQVSVDKRFDWAKERRTKREEDEAYSLLGIFDVQIPLIYGEGRSKAMRRLKLEIERAGQLQHGDRTTRHASPKQQRLHWRNGLGEMLFDDYHEDRPGALQSLQYHLNTDAYLDRANTHDYRADDAPGNDLTDMEMGFSSMPPLDLTVSIPKGLHVAKSQQVPIYARDDRELFEILRFVYSKHTPPVLLHLKRVFKPIKGIHFINFAHDRDIFTECDRECPSVRPSQWPQQIATARPGHISLGLDPPIGPYLMMDFLNHPETMRSGTTRILQIFSRKDPSQSSSHGVGWGLRFEESWNYRRIWCAMAAVMWLGSQMLMGFALIIFGKGSMLGLLAVPTLLGVAMITVIAVTG